MNKRIQKIEISDDLNPIAIKVYCYEELSDTSKEAFIKAFGVVYAKELWGAPIGCNVEFVTSEATVDFSKHTIIYDGSYRERNFEAYED